MKKIITLFLTLLIYLIPHAETLPEDGYYRVENYKTGRYVFITDNKGSVNMATTDADLLAIELWKSKEKAISDPASVLYFAKEGTRQYNISSQGTSVHQIIDMYASIREASSGVYYCYGSKSGMVKYLSDGETSDAQKGYMVIDNTGDYRKWRIEPITSSGSNYFGVKTTLTIGSKNYATMYASFPFKTYSSSVKAYYVKTVANGMAVIEEAKNGVPAATGILFISDKTSPSDNRLDIGGSPSALSGNMLSGVYFDNSLKNHYNRTAYNPKTMRVLGKCADGSAGFITSNIDFLPANQAYLKVPEGTPSELKIVTQSEYDAYMTKMPKEVTLNKTEATIIEGNTLQLTASITPADAINKTLTWTSSNESIAKVNNNGMITAVKTGTADIIVKTINGKSAICKVTVCQKYPSTITLNKSTIDMIEGDSQTLSITFSPSNAGDKSISWSTSDKNVAQVDQTGKISATGNGSCVITASSPGGAKATCTVNVTAKYAKKIVVTPAYPKLTVGETLQLSAKLSPDVIHDRTYTWSSSDATVASVDQNGLLKALNPGTSIVSATAPNGVKGAITVTVNAPLPSSIEIIPSSIEITEGDIITLQTKVLPENADNYNLTWKTSNMYVATVTSLGQVKALSSGTATITVKTSNDLSATCKITVVKPSVPVEDITLSSTSMLLKEGETGVLTAVVIPSNATEKTVVWSSSNPDVAVFDNNTVKALSEGETDITASAGGKSATCHVTVVPAEEPQTYPESVKLSESSLTLGKGETFTLSVTIEPDNTTEKDVVWTSLDSSVAEVTEDGTVTAIGGGETTILVSTVNGLMDSCSVKVIVPVEAIILDRTDIEIPENSDFLLVATVLPEDATDGTLFWQSSDTSIATVDQTGLVTVHKVGAATITASSTDGSNISASCTVGVVVCVEMLIGPDETIDVYDINGSMIIRDADRDQLKKLQKGLYIIGGRKVIVP